MCGVDKEDWWASKYATTIKEIDTQVHKRICSHLGEQLADSTSKTLHLGNSKSKDITVQNLQKLLMMPVSIFKNIL